MNIPLDSHIIAERVATLKNASIFSQTEESLLHNIAHALSELVYEANHTIFHKGDQGFSMYIIVEGSVRVHDADYTFAILKKGQVFGEYALLDTEERSASVSTLERTKLLVLEQEVFYEMMLNHIDIIKGILQVLVDRSRLNNKLQEELNRERQKVEQQNEEISQRNEEILAQNEEILQQQNQIEIQNDLLKEKNNLITSSIDYALHIQQALLPKAEELKNFLSESFIFYKGKDIVSGDFYWFTQRTDAEGNAKIILAAVDCTGHGVPGALMSCLGISYLNQIVEFQGITDVAKILDNLNNFIRTTLHQENSHNHDGMDVAICAIDLKNKTLEFAGANNDLIYIHKGEMREVKADKFSVGGFSLPGERHFVKHTVTFNSPTSFYIFSDGYRDQFGFINDKKFNLKRFRELLLNIHDKEIESQHFIIKKLHEEWKGFSEQTDDILLIGFRL